MVRPLLLLAAAAALFALDSGIAAEFCILPKGQIPDDWRLGPLKDFDGYFPFTPIADAKAWQLRSDDVRTQIKVALGLWPMPSRTPLKAVIHGFVRRDDYTVEKVFFESMPGFFVTGSLYRPILPAAGPDGAAAKYPAVLYEHGHWPGGRFMYAEDAEMRRALSTGAERFESAARNHLEAACVQLARMGCVVFQCDMIGYADSTQISLEIAHKFAKQRPEMNTRDNWGLYSPQAESNAQSVIGLQIWNAIRSLDFLQSLPDVDATRIGVTGASGGGTQTMLLSAIDPRVTTAFPAVMVSTAMQGGCTCENASLLRVGTGNIEFAALFAPKPMAMTAANDWTKEMPEKGFPELKQQWAMLGAPDNVKLTALLQFPHNYNAPSRAAMSAWFNEHLNLRQTEEALKERDFKLLSHDESSVWDASHSQPLGGPDFERKLLREWHDDSQAQLYKSSEEFERIARPAFARIIGRTIPDSGTQRWQVGKQKTVRGGSALAGLIETPEFHEQLPAIYVYPEKWKSDKAVLWLDPRGKAALFETTDGLDELIPSPEIASLLKAGVAVLGVDLFGTGEFLKNGDPLAPRHVANPREAAAFTFGYNPTLFAERTRDALIVISLIRKTKAAPKLALAGWGEMGPVAAAANAIAGAEITAAVVESSGFRFADVDDIWGPHFLPGAAKYGDLPGLLALSAPRPTYILGEKEIPELARRAYGDAGGRVITLGADRSTAIDWLKQRLD